MLTRLSGHGNLSATSGRYVYAVLRIALGRAAKQGKVLRNVATLVDPPRKTEREIQPLSVAQIRTFLDSVRGDRLEALYIAAVGTGMRHGELVGLRRVDVNLDAGTLRVEHSLQRGTRSLAAPKTARARRILQLAPFVADARESIAVGRWPTDVVIVDGQAEVLKAIAPDQAERLATASNAKFPEYRATARAYRNNGGIRIRIPKVVIWTDFTKDPTRFRFDSVAE